ncbi:MAG: radical SAM protein [Acidobacteriaceae bacterium]|nr:radical SAM protein [Acidobacteriaceae bacterium]
METLIQISPQSLTGVQTEPTATPLKSAHRGYYIYVTEACNLRCSYCFVTDKQNHNHLSDRMAVTIADFVMADASENKDAYIHFFGGEPLIRANTVDYLAGTFRTWSRKTGITLRLGITTNGTLLNTRNCEMLKRHQIGVQLSLDGGKQGNDVHRQIMGGTQRGLRAAGAFEMVQIENYLEIFRRGAA